MFGNFAEFLYAEAEPNGGAEFAKCVVAVHDIPGVALMSRFIASRPAVDRLSVLQRSYGESRLNVGEDFIYWAASRHGPGPIGLLALRYAVTAARLQWRKQIRFRQSQNGRACSAYTAMSVAEFSAINARQAWANWRTIPRNLSGRLPNRPVFALDLCCGTGDSTAVLAFYCPEGSQVHGLEYNPAFVRAARRRTYVNRWNESARVSFAAQSVLDTFCDERGEPLPDGCADLVNASGAIGCHFDGQSTARVANECRRVLHEAGLALIDSGPEGTGRAALIEIFASRGFVYAGEARSCTLDRMRQLCFVRS